KHNEATGEDNRAGTDDNRSWNCGVEGPTDDPEVLALRRQQVRNFLGTLFLSQGVPMLLGGDELGRTQRGNNNAYCQDTPVSWYDWNAVDRDLLGWTQRLIALRQAHPVFRRRRFFQGRPLRRAGPDAPGPEIDHLPDIAWFRPDGGEMTDSDWEVGYAKSLAVYLNGAALPAPDVPGPPVVAASFYLRSTAWDHEIDFVWPAARWAARWDVVLDSADGLAADVMRPAARFRAGHAVRVSGHRLVVLESANRPGGLT